MFSRGRGDNSASSGGAGAGYAGAGHPVESGPRARLNDYRDAANSNPGFVGASNAYQGSYDCDPSAVRNPSSNPQGYYQQRQAPADPNASYYANQQQQQVGVSLDIFVFRNLPVSRDQCCQGLGIVYHFA